MTSSQKTWAVQNWSRLLRRFHEEDDGGAIKKSRYTEEQITYVLRQAEAGTPVADVCRGMGISEATFYVWKKKYAGLGMSELRLDLARLIRLQPAVGLLPAVERLFREPS